MHETAIARSIIETAKQEAEKCKTGKKQQETGEKSERKIISIEVDVGDLAHLPAEEFEQTIKTMTDWKIKINKTPAEIRCSCGYKGKPVITEHCHDFSLFHCPECKNNGGSENRNRIEILSGKDIVLKNVEFEEYLTPTKFTKTQYLYTL